MNVFQQNIFGGEDKVITQIPVFVYRNRKREGFYLASDIDHADFADEDGDVTELIDMLIHFNKDYSKPSEEAAWQALSKLHGEKATEMYVLEKCYLTIDEFNIMAEEYGLPVFSGVSI